MWLLSWVTGYTFWDRRWIEEIRRTVVRSKCETTELYRTVWGYHMLRTDDKRAAKTVWNYKPEDAEQLGDRGRDCGSKCNGIGTDQNGVSPCDWWTMLILMMIMIMIMTVAVLLYHAGNRGFCHWLWIFWSRFPMFLFFPMKRLITSLNDPIS
jgi:hypothetical protein